jgi:hypothetical protein
VLPNILEKLQEMFWHLMNSKNIFIDSKQYFKHL